jgi:hypothetical protein
VFLFYVMWQLKKADPDVHIVVHSGEGSGTTQYWYFHNSTVQKGQASHFTTLLESSDTYYLVDGTPPRSRMNERRAMTLMVSSPLKDRFHAFQKETGVSTLFMPTWRWYEIKAARLAVFPSYDKEQAKENFRIAGGVIRYVLSKPDKERKIDLKGDITAAVDRSNVLEIMRSAGNKGHPEQVSDQLLHYVEDPNRDAEPYTGYVLDWASRSRHELFSHYCTYLDHLCF